MNPEHLCMACMEDAGEAAICPHCGAERNQPASSLLHLPPRSVLHDQYLVGRVLGQGGFGITYIAWDLNLARRLAVKEYLPGGVATRTSGERTVIPYSGQSQKDFEWGLEKFLEEARVIARFQNFPGIVAVLNFFRENGTAYLVMEYLEGVTLEEYLRRKGGTLAPDLAVRILLPVMDALREVHKAGVLHRDISPDNVYLSNTGQVKVLDFGAARYALSEHSRNLSVILKEGYAPEEQYRSKGNQGPWTDVYATAATLYRVITGRVPQPSLDRKETDEVAPPSALGIEIAPHIEAALMKALAIRAGDRFQSMQDFQAALLNEQARAAAAPETAIVIPPPAEETKVLPRPVFDGGETKPYVHVPPALSEETKAIVVPRPDLEDTKPVPLRKPEPAPGPRKMLPVWMMAAIAAIAGVVGYAVFRGKPAPKSAPPASESSREEPARVNPGPGTVPPPPVPSPKPTPMPETAARGDTNPEPAADPVLSAAHIRMFEALPRVVRPGQPVTLRWSMDGAGKASITPDVGAVRSEGTVRVTPRGSQAYTLVAQGMDGRPVTQTVNVEMGAPAGEAGSGGPPPAGAPVQIVTFEARPNAVGAGRGTTLRWSVRGATSVIIQPGLGVVETSGNRTVYPNATTHYTLTARSAGGGAPVSAEADVEVLERQAGGAAYNQGAGAAVPGRPAFSVYVMHDHGGGGAIGGALGSTRVLGRVRPNLGPGSCNGELKIVGQNIQFQSQGGHSFNYPLSEITEVRQNRLSIQGNPAFHIKFQDGGNYNFVPRSSDVTRAVEAIDAARGR